jgi:hypothetical protein
MTTFRLLRQTNRFSRFAQVSVDLAPSNQPEVEVTATVAGLYRREAELGARWALGGLPDPARVIVTDVVASDTDTGVGDVHEATAHAVWQALQVQHSVPYVAFSDPEMLAAWLEVMVSRRLEAVTEARHWYHGRRDPDATSLIHAWLLFENAVPLELHGRGDQLLLAKRDPYESYMVDDYGEVTVSPALPPDLLSQFVGSRLADGAVIVGHDGRSVCAGMVLRFDNKDLVVGSLGDEWVLAAGAEPATIDPCWAVQPFVRNTSR